VRCANVSPDRFRALASLGIGGEWAVGGISGQSVPESRRVEAGAILYRLRRWGSHSPVSELSDRRRVAGGLARVLVAVVFLCGLIPAVVVLGVRIFLHESERWQQAARVSPAPRLGALFAPDMRANTFSGLFTAVMALLAWWSCNAFSPILASSLAKDAELAGGLDAAETTALVEEWKAHAANWFSVGALAGTLLAIPVAKRFGRRMMFAAYFALSLAAILANFGLDLPPLWRIRGYFAIGLGVYGIFAAFTFYLPELFPTRLRGVGAGFCYNLGRIVTAAGPLLVGAVSMRAGGSSAALLDTLLWVAAIRHRASRHALIVETRGRPLPQ
jgi:hypothetical protein